MRYVVVSALFVLSLIILVYMSLQSNPIHEQLSYVDCNKTSEGIMKSHKQYLLNYGWHIKSICSTSNEQVNYSTERIEMLQLGGLDLEPYINARKEAKITMYILNEKQNNGDKITATIFEIDGQLIGGYGLLVNRNPGIISLSDKKRLIQEGIISEKKPLNISHAQSNFSANILLN